jgi:hypothetical protein
MPRLKITEAEELRIRQFLKEKFPDLPDSANVEPKIAAVHDGVSVQTVDRNYERVNLSKNRYAINVGYLRQPHR